MLNPSSPSTNIHPLLVFLAVMSGHAGGVTAATRRDSILARAPGQSEQAINGNKGNITIAVAATITAVAAILVALFVFRCIRRQRRAAAAHPEMAQATALLVPLSTADTSGTAGARRPRRPRRQPSTQTVPEYSEQAGDEEMVLGKAEEEAIHLETVSAPNSTLSTISSRDSNEDAHYAATAAHPSRSRASYAASRTTLHDIVNPAPELRMDRVDSIYDQAPSILGSSDNGHQALLMPGANESSLTLDEVPLDGMPPVGSRRSSSFFASPAYVNRSRSRSIDIVRTMSAAQEQPQAGTSNSRLASSGSSLVPPESRRTSSFLSIFPRRQSASTLLPLHQPLPDSRREALRNREISAPLSDTLVKSSYTYPKAGINPIQAAWLGSRDHITRLTTYLDTAPPAFEEEDESLEMDRRTSRDTLAPLQSSSQLTQTSDAENLARHATRSSSSNALAELEEESAHLSSLVHQESLRRASLPPHMVALPPSLPVSPISPRTIGGGNADWPVSRAASLARAHSLARHRLSSDQNVVGRQNSIARRRVQSEVQGATSSAAAIPSSPVPRSESPTPLSRNNARPVLSLSTSSTASSLVARA